MESYLDNPVYFALLTGDAHQNRGNAEVKYFDEEVSPFAGFDENYRHGFQQLYDLLPEGRRILFVSPKSFTPPMGWQLKAEVKGLQFILPPSVEMQQAIEPVPLTLTNVEEMVQLAALTRPGPFASRTIEFGNYYGFFEKEKLAAMTGQRLHIANYTEVSAVCTHPDFLGRGYAGDLVKHQVNLIRSQGQIPFLHVRDDNERAIALYKRLGFEIRKPMNFYFLKRE